MAGGIPTPGGASIGEDIAVESGVADSTYTEGTQTAPASGTVVCPAQTPGAGVFEVFVDAGYLFTAPAVAEAANMIFQKNGATFAILPVPGALGINTFGPFRMTLIGTDTIRVVSGANAGTASVVYGACITCKRVA